MPYSDVSIVPTKYQDGKIQTPNSLMMKGIGHAFSRLGTSKQQTTHLFQVGEKVYPSRIERQPGQRQDHPGHRRL